MAEKTSEQERTLEMRVAELEDKLQQMHITEEEMKAYNKVSAALGGGVQEQAALTPQPDSCVTQCVRACTVVSQCVRACTIRACTIRQCTIRQCTIRQCTIISQCIRDCVNECGGGWGGGFSGGGDFGDLGG